MKLLDADLNKKKRVEFVKNKVTCRFDGFTVPDVNEQRRKRVVNETSRIFVVIIAHGVPRTYKFS